MDANGVLGVPLSSELALKWPQYLNAVALLDPPLVFHVNVSEFNF
jgi:hypothetical protein